ncbi:DUF998 domain-containing protein [uncultured Microbacterium sp.]|uniref:DUF998 domain-containing protein n=1 Tax=uncultured Microbacterium sp. TaxID=191216 RepID=UPI0025FC37B5|nr:DUF998 domain-containing protein [uncultured Microbacterium sp.]
MYTFTRGRVQIGASLWAVGLPLLPLQVLVAMQWPSGYSIADNAISDLGVTSCGVFSDHSTTARLICSPWHAVFNGGMVVSGALITAGAVLLGGSWGGRTGRTGSVLAAVSGVFVILVGCFPWNTFPELHDAAALGQALTQWSAMILLAAAAGRGAFRALTFATVAVSLASFVVFVDGLEGGRSPLLPLGIAERLAFDTLTLWTAAVGVSVAVQVARRTPTTRGLRPSPAVPEMTP